MLIRISGGNRGIKEYLINGIKQDRYFSRDELDERLILMGDLNQADSVINSITDPGKDAYFHITLSFKEDYLSNDTLQQIAKEFRGFYFNRFTDEELEFYAEAHLPRIKNYKTKDGEIIQRKPHIHIIVPKTLAVTKEMDLPAKVKIIK